MTTISAEIATDVSVSYLWVLTRVIIDRFFCMMVSTISTISGQAAQERTDALSVATIGTSHCDQACAHDVVRPAFGGGTHQCWPRQK